jgi:hypothetical protein
MLVLTALFFSLTAYSQLTILSDSDTLICISLYKAKDVVKTYYKVEELSYIDSVNMVVIAYKDSCIIAQNKEISLYKQLDSNNVKIIEDFREEKEILTAAINKENMKYRQQKTYKFLAIACGAFSTIYTSWKWITK